MPNFTPDALIAYGWNERVDALFAGDAAIHPEAGDAGGVIPVRITRVVRSGCFAVGPDGEERPLPATPLPAVGDWCAAAPDGIRRVLPRWSALGRADPDGTGVQVLAANVDVVAITAPADRASAARVEREVALAWDSGAVPLVVVTKVDLDPSGVADTLASRLAGVDIVEASATTGAGVDRLRDRLRPDRTVVLLGPSGAGKSTLANALLGGARFATGEVRAEDGRGRHTTTSRQLVAIPGGGVLIDTPGLRSLGMTGGVEVGDAFPDVEALAGGCRFSDCAHDREPGCAVTGAVAAGALDPDRLRNFTELTAEAAAERRRHDPLARQAEPRASKARTRDGRANNKRHRR